MDRFVFLQALKSTRAEAQARLLTHEKHMLALIDCKNSQWHDAAMEVFAGRREVAMLDRVIASEEENCPRGVRPSPTAFAQVEPAAVADDDRSCPIGADALPIG